MLNVRLGVFPKGTYLLSISQDHNWAHLSIDLPEAGGWQTYHHTPSPSGLLCWRAWLQIIIAQELPWWREWSVLRTDLTSLQSHVHPQAITVLFQVVGLWSRVNHQTLSLPCPSSRPACTRWSSGPVENVGPFPFLSNSGLYPVSFNRGSGWGLIACNLPVYGSPHFSTLCRDDIVDQIDLSLTMSQWNEMQCRALSRSGLELQFYSRVCISQRGFSHNNECVKWRCTFHGWSIALIPNPAIKSAFIFYCVRWIWEGWVTNIKKNKRARLVSLRKVAGILWRIMPDIITYLLLERWGPTVITQCEYFLIHSTTSLLTKVTTNRVLVVGQRSKGLKATEPLFLSFATNDSTVSSDARWIISRN